MNITFLDKIISVLTYLSLGFFGLIWIIFAHVTKKYISRFVYFNIFQSIFISVLFTVISLLFDITINFLIEFPFIGSLVEKFYILFVQKPIYLDLSTLNLLVLALIIYLCACSFFGKIPKLPFITNVIRDNFGR